MDGADMGGTDSNDIHFYEPANGHGLRHDPFNAIVGPRPIGAPASRPRRIGRLADLPGVPRGPRWSEIWPSSDDQNDNEGGA